MDLQLACESTFIQNSTGNAPKIGPATAHEAKKKQIYKPLRRSVDQSEQTTDLLVGCPVQLTRVRSNATRQEVNRQGSREQREVP